MIRAHGTMPDGQHALILVLEPRNVERLTDGDPIVLDLKPYAGGLLSESLYLVIEAPEDFDARLKELAEQATEDGAKVNVVQKPARGVQ